MSDVDRGLVWGLAVPNSVHPVCVCWIPRVADRGGQTKDLKLVPEVRGPNGIVEGGRWTRAATNDGSYLSEIPESDKGLAAKGKVVEHYMLEKFIDTFPHDLLDHGHFLPYDQVGLT